MKVNIQYNKYLDPIFVAYVHSQEKWANYPVPEKELVLEKTESFKQIWEEWGDKIIEAIQEIVGVSFERNIIDVYIVSLNPRTFSNPIVIKSDYSPEEFVNLLTEELIHSIFNNGQLWKSIFKHAKWKYSEENDSVLIHFIVFSIMKEVFKKINKQFTKEDKSPDYMRAHEMADDDSYYILDALKK